MIVDNCQAAQPATEFSRHMAEVQHRREALEEARRKQARDPAAIRERMIDKFTGRRIASTGDVIVDGGQVGGDV